MSLMISNSESKLSCHTSLTRRSSPVEVFPVNPSATCVRQVRYVQLCDTGQQSKQLVQLWVSGALSPDERPANILRSICEHLLVELPH